MKAKCAFFLVVVIAGFVCTSQSKQTALEIYHSTIDDACYCAGCTFPPVCAVLMAEYDFDISGACGTEGWTSVDRTAQSGTWFHVDDHLPLSGTKSMWCGARPSGAPPLCDYATLPGYGNDWSQMLSSKWFSVEGDVTLSLVVSFDAEPGYDFGFIEYLPAGGFATWKELSSFTGVVPDQVVVHTIENSSDELEGGLRFRFRFASDEACSDEDGVYDSEGAFRVDDVSVSDGTGLLHTEDFEAESIGDVISADSTWAAGAYAGFGDYAHIFQGPSFVQEDLCTTNPGCAFAFFEGSTYNYACGNHPGQPVVPYSGEVDPYSDPMERHVLNEVQSPWIDWNQPYVPAGPISGAMLEFDVYDDLSLENLVFYTWRIRSKTAAGTGPWRDRETVYYGGSKNWITVREEVGDLIEPGATQVQVALGVADLYSTWNGYYGDGACHSHAPLFDNVRFYRLWIEGPAWNVQDADLFQDNFPCDGSTSGTVRMDMARDISPLSDAGVRPGDSVVVSVSEPNVGLGTDPTYGRPAVYIHVRPTSTHSGTVVSGDVARWPVVGVSGGWTRLLMDRVYAGGIVVPNKYCVDLNDNLFAPPDRVDFYFSATDANNRTTYYMSGLDQGENRFTSTTVSQALAEECPLEIQCLPTGTTDILYVDDCNNRGAQQHFDAAFDRLGVQPDRYDVRAASSLIGNGLGSRAASGQIVDVYKNILWNSGDLPRGTIGDGSGRPGKSPDAQLLYEFLDQSTAWNPGLYISGDHVATELEDLAGGAAADLLTYIRYNLIASDHRISGHQKSPRAIGALSGTTFQHPGPPPSPDTLVAYGGCSNSVGLDVLEPVGTAGIEMYYDPNPDQGAVISQSTVNAHGRTARVFLAGFSYHDIRDDGTGFPYDAADHLAHILNSFENPVMPTAAGSPVVFENALSQNYPNPFNPVTTIEYSISGRSRVSLCVYNSLGQLVRTLVDAEQSPKVGGFTVQWDGRSDSGNPVASGVYFYRLVTGDYTHTKKLVLLK